MNRTTAARPRSPTGCLLLGTVSIDLANLQVRRAGTVKTLTPLEARLLEHLAGASGAAVPRTEIEREIWGMSDRTRSDAVPVAIRRLRAKIELDPTRPTLLVTVRGFGWRLALDEQDARLSGMEAARTLVVRSGLHMARGDVEAARADLQEALGLIDEHRSTAAHSRLPPPNRHLS